MPFTQAENGNICLLLAHDLFASDFWANLVESFSPIQLPTPDSECCLGEDRLRFNLRVLLS